MRSGKRKGKADIAARLPLAALCASPVCLIAVFATFVIIFVSKAAS